MLCSALVRPAVVPLSSFLRRFSSVSSETRRNFGLQSNVQKFIAPPLVYISGEEMTRYCMSLILKEWVEPHMDTSAWEFYDLSCKSRDDTNDQVLKDAVAAGARVKAIFKEPTITPTDVQKEAMGLKKAWGSPNGLMRRGWNGITISRDTIHIEGVELGFKNPVLFERHAVGGEYGAGFKQVGSGRLMTTFFPDDVNQPPVIVDARHLTDSANAAVVYHNPLDNVPDLAHIFFQRCLAANVVPYVVTKKTVFKWQEPFWSILQGIFNQHYKPQFAAAGLLKKTDGELAHLISDAATMQIIRWTDGGFGMACHNYDGDMLTDEVAQVHRSPGFITSNLVGKAEDGSLIREFEASHGTVTDLYNAHLRGESTSMNPLGMAEALLGALQHAGEQADAETKETTLNYCKALRKAMHNTFRYGQGTRDLCGPNGLSTEDFISKVAWRLGRYHSEEEIVAQETVVPDVQHDVLAAVDEKKMFEMFDSFDTTRSGNLSFDEFKAMAVKLGVAPKLRTKQYKAEEER